MENIRKITLKINDKIEIVITYPSDFYELHCCTEGSIVFTNNASEITLAHDSVYYNLLELQSLLQKALAHQLILPTTIFKNLGFLFNEYSAVICGEKQKESTDLIYIQKNNESYWPGNDYSLWAYDMTSWIYNEPDGSIVFEITPFYPYMYCEPEEKPDYIPYEKWIKTYKPYFITTLSKETALQWLEQAEHIIKIVEDNQKRWDNRPKEDVES
jgi:hypothetical protein